MSAVAWNKARRDRNVAAKRCINENKAGTHGPATHGRRCEACATVNRCRPVIARRRRLGFEPPPRVRAIEPVIAVGLPTPRASFTIDVSRAKWAA